MDISKYVKSAGAALRAHAPELLTAIGIGGFLTTTTLAVTATPKALKLIEERKKAEKTDKLTPRQVVQTVWKCYIPAIGTGIASAGCVIWASAENGRRNAALVATYSLSENALKLYREKTAEAVGEDREKEIHQQVLREKTVQSPASSSEIIMTPTGRTLCYDASFGRFFMGSKKRINDAIATVNSRLYSEMYISLNEFYALLGLPGVAVGEQLGWNADKGPLGVSFEKIELEDVEDCLSFEYDVPPVYEYYKMY